MHRKLIINFEENLFLKLMLELVLEIECLRA